MMETDITPHDTAVSVEDCLDNLLNTRDISVYLDALKVLRRKYLIVMGVKDTSGYYMPDDVLRRIHELGFVHFTKKDHEMYVGIVDRGSIIFGKNGGGIKWKGRI